MSAVPVEVSAYVEAVADRVTEVLDGRCLAIYTTGSLALGDYHPRRSDIDLMVVASEPVEVSGRLALAEGLDHRRLPCPAAGLELVLYAQTFVAEPSIEAGYLLNINTGRALPPVVSCDPRDGSSFWYPIDRAITYQSGRAIRGRPPRQVLAALPVASLLSVLRAAVEAQAQPRAGLPLDNAVLNACRALCFAEEHRWFPKVAAARKTARSAGHFARLIEDAVDSYESGRDTANTLPSADVSDFLAQAVLRVGAAAESGGQATARAIPARHSTSSAW